MPFLPSSQLVEAAPSFCDRFLFQIPQESFCVLLVPAIRKRVMHQYPALNHVCRQQNPMALTDVDRYRNLFDVEQIFVLCIPLNCNK
jgi:hypothetical protein